MEINYKKKIIKNIKKLKFYKNLVLFIFKTN